MKADIVCLDRLASQLEEDAKTFRGLNPTAMLSVAEIIRAAIGAPISWPSREAGFAYGDKYYRGSNSHRAAFNHGVKWAVENYTPTIDVVERFPRTESAQLQPHQPTSSENETGAIAGTESD